MITIKFLKIKKTIMVKNAADAIAILNSTDEDIRISCTKWDLNDLAALKAEKKLILKVFN
jgi:hypothetical protein